LVTVDKFSKWIEACPIMNLRAEQAVSFCTDITHRFGVPNFIIIDNESQFTGRKFLEFCDKNHIRVYGAEAVLPTDLEYGSTKVKDYDESANQQACEDSLDQLYEARTVALMHSARYQQALRRYQAQKVRRRNFDEGDLVLRMRQDNRGRHKL
jgi:hypothetical protein